MHRMTRTPKTAMPSLKKIALKKSAQQKVYFINRHPGSIAWAKKQALPIDCFLEHMEDINIFEAGDTVIGSLPVHIIAELNNNGVRFLHFQLDLPKHQRGIELSAEDIDALDVQLREFMVCSLEPVTYRGNVA